MVDQRVQQYLEYKSKEPVDLMHVHLQILHTNQQLFVTHICPGLQLATSEAVCQATWARDAAAETPQGPRELKDGLNEASKV